MDFSSLLFIYFGHINMCKNTNEKPVFFFHQNLWDIWTKINISLRDQGKNNVNASLECKTFRLFQEWFERKSEAHLRITTWVRARPTWQAKGRRVTSGWESPGFLRVLLRGLSKYRTSISQKVVKIGKHLAWSQIWWFTKESKAEVGGLLKVRGQPGIPCKTIPTQQIWPQRVFHGFFVCLFVILHVS